MVAVRRALVWSLRRPDELDLGPHERAMDRIERHQALLARISPVLAVAVEQRPGEALASAGGQIHDEKGEVVGDVELAQARLELDAVNDLRRILEQHVLSTQVAVDLSHEATSGAHVEHLFMDDDKRVDKALEREHALDLGALLDELEQLVEVFHDAPLNRQRRHAGGRHLTRLSVKPGQQTPDGLHILGPQLAATESFSQREPLVVAAHLDEVIERARVILGGEFEAAARARDSAHAEVHIRRETAVETDLLAAQLAPATGAAVVDERQDDRLLELVSAIAREEDPGDVGLADEHLRRSRRVEAWLRERCPDLVRIRWLTGRSGVGDHFWMMDPGASGPGLAALSQCFTRRLHTVSKPSSCGAVSKR